MFGALLGGIGDAMFLADLPPICGGIGASPGAARFDSVRWCLMCCLTWCISACVLARALRLPDGRRSHSVDQPILKGRPCGFHRRDDLQFALRQIMFVLLPHLKSAGMRSLNPQADVIDKLMPAFRGHT